MRLVKEITDQCSLSYFVNRWSLKKAIVFELSYSGPLTWKTLCRRMQGEWSFPATLDEVLARIPKEYLSMQSNLVELPALQAVADAPNAATAARCWVRYFAPLQYVVDDEPPPGSSEKYWLTHCSMCSS